MDATGDENKVELEDQFILRLPPIEAEEIQAALKKKSKKFKKALKIELEDDLRNGIVYVNKKPLHATLVDLPTIIESNKMIDNVNLYKTADICQMLICSHEPQNFLNSPDINPSDTTQNPDVKKYSYQHGITPSLKNVRKFRFRRTLKNKNDAQETADIEKEVLMLLRMDNEAISTRYELLCEREKYDVLSSKECERSIFGELSDSDDSTSKKSSSSERGDNDIMDFTR